MVSGWVSRARLKQGKTFLNDGTQQHTTFDGVADYIAALDNVCGMAQRTLNIFENNFADIGFNAESRYDTLRHFLVSSSTSRLQLLAHDPQHLIRFCPRMMMLLREFNHSMAIYQTPSHMKTYTEAFAVADNAHFVRRYHFDDTRGLLAKNDAEGARQLNSRFNEMWVASHSGATPTKLGL